MEHIINVPTLVHIPATALTIHDPAVIVNQLNEPAVDMLIDTSAAVNLIAWLRPGLSVGEQLTVRMLRRPGVGTSYNQATVDLKVLIPSSLEGSQDYNGILTASGADATLLRFTSFASNTAFFGPAFAIFEWTGIQWAVIKQKMPS